MTEQPDVPAAIRALLVERRLRLYAQARFTASARRAAWTTIHSQKDSR
ncbi:hypothetical protein [Streptomyces poriferorum]|uniref:Uncharacterized protein n=1 Tax=Streptomyces poriferorum TaxID=2798799 RepID=A0ABY9IYQ0_9ACTN|nr:MULTISPECIES: hypothetical protein [unclassified Streptomyces]MDP5310411.1 hypothetical protein [Streptomyces sp. Alt4]WLQ60435.1 hypothetical protein P8A19_35650 [Streptomyces sp. Alt2]